MRNAFRRSKGRRRARSVGAEAARTLSVAAEMALLCPSGIDVWMQRELAGCFERPRDGTASRR